MLRPKELAMSKAKNYDFTIVVPIYNEEDNMDRLVRQLSAYIAKAPVKACVLLVNDGSKDRGLEMMKKTCLDSQNFFCITFETNHGFSTTVKAGINMTESRYIGYIDADLQTSPEDFNKLLAFMQDYQLVSGIRTERRDISFKKLQSRFANGFHRMMIGDTATDTGCPLKMMWTDYAQRLPFFSGIYRFLPTLLTLVGGKFMEMPIRHYPRTVGVSKYHLLNRSVGPSIDCFAFRWLRQRYIRYRIRDSNL